MDVVQSQRRISSGLKRIKTRGETYYKVSVGTAKSYWFAGEQLRTSGMPVKQLKAELRICWNLNAAVKENESVFAHDIIYSFGKAPN